jgi:hypothetical protein
LTTKQIYFCGDYQLSAICHNIFHSRTFLIIITMAASSGGFSFDFLPPETTGDTDIPIVQESTATQSQQERRPFAWISNLPELLAERAEQEIVYHDVSLRGSSTTEQQRHETMPAMASIGEDEEEGEAMPMPMDPIDRFQLRRVDWETCSFLQATTTLANDNDSSNATESAESSNNQKQVWERTDIDPGKYEGGMKIWECSLDLVRYLAQQQAQQVEDNNNGVGDNSNGNDRSPWNLARGGYVLELGCGHGLPACYLLRQALDQQRQQQELVGKDDVTSTGTSNAAADVVVADTDDKRSSKPWKIVFTDYNDFVVQDVTVSNVVINAAAVNVPIADLVPHVIMGAGDWLDLSRQLQLQSSSSSDNNTADAHQQILSESGSSSSPIAEQSQLPADGKFDWILAAETIYSEQAAKETALFLVRHLKHTTGVALIATKRYYFGVGGGSDAFREAVHAAAEQEQQCEHGGMEPIQVQVKVETVRVHDNGTGNIREILSVQVLPPANC